MNQIAYSQTFVHSPGEPTGPSIVIHTTQGTVTVTNVYLSSVGWDEEYLIFKKTSSYELLYDVDDSSFVVSIQKGPLQKVRQDAEQAFLFSLGITPSEACKLKVVVGVPRSLDRSMAHKALPLSLCVLVHSSQR
jgi:hypothetical protein